MVCCIWRIGLYFGCMGRAGAPVGWDGNHSAVPAVRRGGEAGSGCPHRRQGCGNRPLPLCVRRRSLLAASHKLNGAQTLRVQVRFKAPPQGVLLARNRPAEGVRGFEFGFSGRHHSDFRGSSPAGFISDGYAVASSESWERGSNAAPASVTNISSGLSRGSSVPSR